MQNLFNNPIAKRVQEGTLPSGVDLCASCRYALRRSASNSGFSETRCGQLSGAPRVPEKLAQCSMYLEKGRLALHEMVDIAWVVEVKGKHIGFLSPEELQRRQQFDNASAPRPPLGF